MSERDDPDPGVRGVGRRAFLVGGATAAASAAIPAAALADAGQQAGEHSDDPPGPEQGFPGTVAAQPSPDTLNVTELGGNHSERALRQPRPAPDPQFTRFHRGDTVLVFGDQQRQDTIASDQVVRLVVGDESESLQRDR